MTIVIGVSPAGTNRNPFFVTALLYHAVTQARQSRQLWAKSGIPCGHDSHGSHDSYVVTVFFVTAFFPAVLFPTSPDTFSLLRSRLRNPGPRPLHRGTTGARPQSEAAGKSFS